MTHPPTTRPAGAGRKGVNGVCVRCARAEAEPRLYGEALWDGRFCSGCYFEGYAPSLTIPLVLLGFQRHAQQPRNEHGQSLAVLEAHHPELAVKVGIQGDVQPHRPFVRIVRVAHYRKHNASSGGSDTGTGEKAAPLDAVYTVDATDATPYNPGRSETYPCLR